MTKGICIFCTASEGGLHEFITLDAGIKHMATDLQETAVVARVAAGDVVTIDGIYHLNCRTVFRNRHHSIMRTRKNADGGQMEGKKIEP